MEELLVVLQPWERIFLVVKNWKMRFVLPWVMVLFVVRSWKGGGVGIGGSSSAKWSPAFLFSIWVRQRS
ncbi:hypothetical protein E2562_028136 [Oryza meyeriana var. granulata]|uniref:Uncharacterized protein n=1 Tax=Oryza meyeriana var. granulata TaxID=110450 RepID=A0A6G1D8I3_9ORYZ|nr:hypothetical protein E2562_028136 [Oryza meyeriana var. granulata]